MVASADLKTLPGASPQRSGNLSTRLRENKREYDIAGIINLTSDQESEHMNLDELRTKSSAEIRDIYNGLVDKQIKRFADRVDAERRTAERLKEAGQWEGDMPSNVKVAAAKKSTKTAKATEPAPAAATPAAKAKGKGSAAPKAATKSGAGKATKKAAAKTPAKAAPAPKAAKAAKTAGKAPAKAKDSVGAPRTNLLYIAVKTDRRMNEGSARTKVYNFIGEYGANGCDRESLENQFVDDETINVKASLDYLVKMEMLKTKDAK
jgi:hypothetical protein